MSCHACLVGTGNLEKYLVIYIENTGVIGKAANQ